MSEGNDMAEVERLREALNKINEIRNSIVGLVTVNWSEHIYPLVAALDEAGFKGMGYPEAREYYGTMLERTNQAEARVAELEEAQYVPGELRCPECDFHLHKRVLRASDGAVGVDLSTDKEFCPNDETEMLRVTWKQACEQMGKLAERQHEEIMELRGKERVM